MNLNSNLIYIKHYNKKNEKNNIITNISWSMKPNEVWLITGSNNSGKDYFLSTLSELPYYIDDNSSFSVFGKSVEIVSLEKAASIIQEERERDDSEYLDGGVDNGRTGRSFILEGANSKIDIDSAKEIKLCGIEKILNRGLKYMSTGEIRRTLLARSLISKKELLILCDPFDGLDTESRTILTSFFCEIAEKQLSANKANTPHIILSLERYVNVPNVVTHILEFSNNAISFCGKKADYEDILNKRISEKTKTRIQDKNDFAKQISHLQNNNSEQIQNDVLVEMNNVNVTWGNHRVLVDLTWSLHKGEHYLIRGPNGSGKTTFLELITGDNMQVYSNDVRVFGIKRGSGETMWDIKAKLGIVSYRLHVEYRMVGNTSLRNVIISGFYDSIGLYETPTDMQIKAATSWLSLGGFAGRETEPFSNLSYGEQRAILILRGAVKCPPILVLDEPCHALDENFRQKILDLLEIIAESGTTTLLHVTHEKDEVLACEKHILEFFADKLPMYNILSLD